MCGTERVNENVGEVIATVLARLELETTLLKRHLPSECAANLEERLKDKVGLTYWLNKNYSYNFHIIHHENMPI